MKNRGKSPSSSFKSQREKGQCVQSAINNMKKFTQSLKKNASVLQSSKKQRLQQSHGNKFTSLSSSISGKQESDLWNENQLNSPLTPSIQPTYHKRQIKTSSLLSSTHLPIKSTQHIKCESVQKNTRIKPQQNLKTQQVIISSSISGSTLNLRRKNLMASVKQIPSDKNKTFFQEKELLNLKPIKNVDEINFDQETVLSIHRQNIFLREQINRYKQVLLLISQKYKKLQQKISEKVQADHLVDVLKEKIICLENQKCQMSQKIQEQNQEIRNYNGKLMKSFDKVLSYFGGSQNRLKILRSQNKYLIQKILSHERVIQVLMEQKQGEDEDEDEEDEMQLGEIIMDESKLKNKYENMLNNSKLLKNNT